ncbi:hypothetical protein [Flavilitoribacter nigricans]|nr:hypothetical protein [Flavilitoribacter nigricans]
MIAIKSGKGIALEILGFLQQLIIRTVRCTWKMGAVLFWNYGGALHLEQ